MENSIYEQAIGQRCVRNKADLPPWLAKMLQGLILLDKHDHCIHSDWSGEPNNQTADTDCVNVNYGGYYEVKKCSDKQSFICQRPVGLAWTTGK